MSRNRPTPAAIELVFWPWKLDPVTGTRVYSTDDTLYPYLVDSDQGKETDR